MASNSITIPNGVEMFCRDAASSRRHRHKSGPESSASCGFLPQPNLSSHNGCTDTHIRLQNKIIYFPVKNKMNKTNSRQAHDLRGSVITVTSVIYRWRRFIAKNYLHKFRFYANPIVTATLTNLNLILNLPKTLN